MQLIRRILFHPATVCVLFCFIIISGESTGYFYLILLMLGLSHGLLHSILGIAGIIFLLMTINRRETTLVSVLNLLGSICFILSLFRFFTQPGASYNYPTFHQSVPLVVMILFLIVLTVFTLYQVKNLITQRLPN